jgi:hypothetical protein
LPRDAPSALPNLDLPYALFEDIYSLLASPPAALGDALCNVLWFGDHWLHRYLLR